MGFIVITDMNGEKIVLNTANVVSFKVSQPKEDSIITTIETNSFGCRYYVQGDLTKELYKALKGKNDTIVALN